MSTAAQNVPNWDALYELAASQEGLFTTAQAAEAGYSLPLLAHHVKGGKFARIRRGIYRLVHFPPGEHEDLVALWLWADGQGVFSHETALALHELSDVLPGQVHMTVPESWKQRRLRVPEGLLLHYDDIDARDQAWRGPVPITSPARTLEDLARRGISPELLAQAVRQALRRGLVQRSELPATAEALADFGGLPK